MSYWALNAVFLIAALAVGTAAAIRLRGRTRKVALAAAGGAAAVVLVLTAVFDNLMIAAGLFTYAPEMISGMTVGLAPLEDFAYPVAAVLLLPGLWILLDRTSKASPSGRRP
ncbi:lycopene cyclase domain-containing protein [Arthrobacter sp. FW306-05-C]|uniref:lycopene cyclase domain-containing protein n=1 Tax=Arthrobacter sp. FW306-05-C TaxID=2879620 RepID=UPI001EFFDA6B|nr:lycopene cyclase domain-containing protein [Arthrobacter sp. FW306-05-C]UKA65900.1 lycopene cyclase domain-containing protein [Arthrobacter sp. FW306-05-C]